MINIKGTGLMLLVLALLLVHILSGCGSPYRHYVASPRSLDEIHSGARVVLLLQDSTFVQGELLLRDADQLVICPDHAMPLYLTYQRQFTSHPEATSSDSVIIDTGRISAIATLDQHNPYETWSDPYGKVSGGLVGFAVGAALVGALWIIL